MEPITDYEQGKVQYNLDFNMGKPNVYGITSTLTITLTLTISLTLTTTLLWYRKQPHLEHGSTSTLTRGTQPIRYNFESDNYPNSDNHPNYDNHPNSDNHPNCDNYCTLTPEATSPIW